MGIKKNIPVDVESVDVQNNQTGEALGEVVLNSGETATIDIRHMKDMLADPARLMALQNVIEKINLAPIERRMDVSSGTTKRFIDGKTKAMKEENLQIFKKELGELKYLISMIID